MCAYTLLCKQTRVGPCKDPGLHGSHLKRVVSEAIKHTELLCFLLRSVHPAFQSLHYQKFILPSTPPVYSPRTHPSLTP